MAKCTYATVHEHLTTSALLIIQDHSKQEMHPITPFARVETRATHWLRSSTSLVPITQDEVDLQITI